MDSISEERSHEVQQILGVAETWRHNRSLYPGWVVLPPQNRRDLWRKTEQWIRYVEKNLGDLTYDERIWVLEELLWRIQRCLRPLDWALRHESISVFGDGFESDWVDEANQQALRRWIRIGLSLLQSYRWNGEYTVVNKINSLLESHVDSFPDLHAWLKYEHILCDLGEGKIEAAVNRLDSWDVPDSFSFWKIKRAGILIEVGNTDKGLREIEEALARIRRSKGGKVASYGALSKEGFALLIRDLTRRANQDAPSSNVDRWTTLANYRADVRTQVEDLMEQVQSSSPGLSAGSHVYQDPMTGLFSGRFSFVEGSGVDEAIRPGYQLAAYFEIGGIPVLYQLSHLGGIGGTISELTDLPKWLRGTYPWYTLSFLTRMQKPSGAYDILKYHLAFGPLSERGEQWADFYNKAQARADFYLDNLKQVRDHHENLTHKSIARYEINLGILELLIPFLSDEAIEKSLELAIQIYLNVESGHLRSKMRDLFSGMLKWMSPSSLQNHLLDLLQFPEANFFSRNCDPFKVGTLRSLNPKSVNSTFQNTGIKTERGIEALHDSTNMLIRRLEYVFSPLLSDSKHSDTDWYSAERILWRLLRLRQVGLLSVEQVNQVEDLVWGNEYTVQRLVSETELEIDQLLNLVDTKASEDANHERIVDIAKRTIRSLDYRGKFFPEEEMPNLAQIRAIINTSSPQDPVDKRSMNVEGRVWIPWTPEDLEPILDWIADKVESVKSHRLGPITQIDQLDQLPFGGDSRKDRRLSKFVARACIPVLRSDSLKTQKSNGDFQDRLVKLVEEMIQKGLPARSALASLHRVGLVDEENIRNSVNEGLGHQEFSAQIDAAEAVYRFCVAPEADTEGKTKLLEVLIRNVLSMAARGQGALEGIIRWLNRCVRDAPNIVRPRHYPDLGTLLQFIGEQVHPPGEPQRVEAQSDEVRKELARWIQKRVQSIKLGIWLSKIQIESKKGNVTETQTADEPVDIVKLTKSLAEMHPHPLIRRAFNETIKEAGLGDTLDPIPYPE